MALNQVQCIPVQTFPGAAAQASLILANASSIACGRLTHERTQVSCVADFLNPDDSSGPAIGLEIFAQGIHHSGMAARWANLQQVRPTG